MLACPRNSSVSCRPLSQSYAAPLVRRSCRMQRTTAGAAARAPTGHTFPDDVLAAVKRYGEHCKAAYIMYEQFKDQRDKRDNDDTSALSAHLADIIGTDVFEQANKGSTSTKGPVGWDNDPPEYIIRDSMRGYSSRTNVFVKPTPDVPTASQAPTIVGAAPLTGVAKKETGVFATTKQKLWRALTAQFRKAEPTYMGYIAEGKGADGVKELVIAFRGTSTYSDWIMNLLGGVAAQGLYQDAAGNDIQGKVHQGFHNMVHDWPTNRLGGLACTEKVAATQAIDAALAAYEAEHGHGNLPPRIICTGHSLGGALATLAAAHIAICHPEYKAPAAGNATPRDRDYAKRRLQVYTFAAPRVGDTEFSSYLRDTLGVIAVQVKNELDPTPDVAPTKSEFMGVARKLAIRTLYAKAATPAATAADPQAAAAAVQRHEKLTKELAAYREVVVTFSDAAASDCDDLIGLEQSAGNQQGGGELADEFDDLGGLESLQNDAAAAPTIVAAAPAKPGQALNFWQRMWYRRQLTRTFETAWCDNPWPSFGCGTFESKKGGKWGGAMHSLEEYLRNVKEWQPKA